MCFGRKLSIVSIALSAVAIGYTFLVQRKTDKVYSLIEKAIDDVSKDIPVDVSEAIVERAVEKAANRKIERAIDRASEETIEFINRNISQRVGSAIHKQYAELKDSVSSEIAKQVADIDISKLKRDVEQKAKEAIVEKFDGKLDSLLDDFNQNLSNVSKIYSSIAESMKRERGTTLHIGG